ncbi:MAG: hypothetical protein M1816_003554 [Peltula sp. TS41687]|nr:MAG: hypothetical protein M1816_003554 [Peltula sp. TS41687]
MPPKQQRIAISSQPSSSSASTAGYNYLRAAYRELTSSENATVVRSIAIFGEVCYCEVDGKGGDGEGMGIVDGRRGTLTEADERWFGA